MILSASRRTDIPAFNSDWFFNRIREGFVLVRNPFSYHQLSKIELTPSVVDCIVFWTKNPANMLNKLELISGYNYYFQFTVTGYGTAVERKVPTKAQVITTFKKLSQKIGADKVIWRYDPIIINDSFNIDFHKRNFELLASELEGCTNLCIISFVDLYQKTKRNMRNINVLHDEKSFYDTAMCLASIAEKHNIKMQACSEFVDLTDAGIEKAKCIDDRLISHIVGHRIQLEKDKHQRDCCTCAASIDIGAYNTCRHECLYCYANYSPRRVENQAKKHHPLSPLLTGHIEPGDIIVHRKVESCIDYQIKLFDQ